MQETVCIASSANPRIKRVLSLRQRGHRHESGLMIVEGEREIRRALANGYDPEELFLSGESTQTQALDDLLETCKQHGAQIASCSSKVFARIAYRDDPGGLLALVPRIQLKMEALTLSPDAMIVIAESIEKPGNLGAILRTADATGVEAVLVCDEKIDICNANVVRASLGAVFSLPVVKADAEVALQWLRNNQVRLFAATPQAEKLYTEANYAGRIGLIVGAEQSGLSQTWFREADEQVRIPMHGQSDSLNVASATSVLLYEALRQKKENA
jgi:TrmH family RNA methyltransferase